MGLWYDDMKHGKGIVVTLDGMYFEGNFDKDNLMVGWFIVLNATFNNISVVSWREVLQVEETRVPVENHCFAVSH